MTIRRSVVTGLLCAIAAGCGEANPANQLSPSSVTTTAPSVSSGANPKLVSQSIGSCPDGNSPSWLQTWTKGSTARLRWTEVAPSIEYHVRVERYDVTNNYVPVGDGDLFVVNQTWTELTLSEGRYRAKIQTRSCGRYMGPWSEELLFSVEGNESNDTNQAPTSGESAEGATALPGQSLTDSSGDIWTLGSYVWPAPGFYDVERNGVYVYGGWGSMLKYHNHQVYHLEADGHWYIPDGSGWWTNMGTGTP